VNATLTVVPVPPSVTLSIVGTPGTPLGLALDPMIGMLLFYLTLILLTFGLADI